MTGQITHIDQTALRVLQTYCDNPSGFLSLNEGNTHFYDAHLDGVVFYRQSGHARIQFGGPVAAPKHRPELLRRFHDAARRDRCRVLAIQVPEPDALMYADQGFTVNQLGMSYAVNLDNLSLRGKKFVKLRNKVSRAKRLGVTPAEARLSDHEGAVSEINRQWLRAKGRFTKEFAFMIGEVGGPAQQHRRLFVATLDDHIVGYCSYAPVYGPRPGWLHDLSRRIPHAPPGVMETINLFAIDQFRSEGVSWLHFGLTPFIGIASEHAMPTASASIDRLFRLLAEKGDAVYPAKSQLDYKLKWDPDYRTPDYLAYQGHITVPLLWNAIRVLNMI